MFPGSSYRFRKLQFWSNFGPDLGSDFPTLGSTLAQLYSNSEFIFQIQFFVDFCVVNGLFDSSVSLIGFFRCQTILMLVW